MPARARLIVEGVTALNACAEGEGMARYTTSVQQLVAHVERRTSYRREDVVGTLADPVRLLVSWSTAQPGVSGGPILDAASKQLLAMNTGGVTAARDTPVSRGGSARARRAARCERLHPVRRGQPYPVRGDACEDAPASCNNLHEALTCVEGVCLAGKSARNSED